MKTCMSMKFINKYYDNAIQQVGLAVGDVNEIQEAARVRKIELQVS